MYLSLINYLIKERVNFFFSKEKKGPHWCRVIMDEATEKIIKQLNYSNFDVLEISGSKWQAFGFRSYVKTDYPEFDITAKKLSQKFDLIIAEQVFEHLLWPYRAGKNVYDMLKPGGYFLITTPFLIRVHLDPIDCTRWTETGLKYFLAECGFPLDGVKSYSWGNLNCMVSNYNRWTIFRKGFHSLTNDPLTPIVVWGIAKK
jgi:SAM-dependent methyltransferase